METVETCGCCGRNVPTPYTHQFRDSRPDMDYCQNCYDWGCDLDTCSLPHQPEEGIMSNEMSNTATEVAKVSWSDLFGSAPDFSAEQFGIEQPPSFEDALANVDPRDSEAALAMLDFLLRTGRLNRLGVLDGGMGYLFAYQEPRGTTKQGYVPGGTQGDRIVDAAVDQARASGKTAARRGICQNCVSAIYQKEDDDCPRLEDEDDFRKSVVCSATGDVHEFA